MGGPALRRTPLFPQHERLGARLVPFAGWEMPLQYEGILAEHRAVRQAAGLFDVSHMGRIALRGAGAGDLVDRLCANDPRAMAPGRALYSPLCAEDGGTIDDLVLYCRSAGADYLAVVNAANCASDREWMAEAARGLPVSVEDVTAGGALLALQGPRASDLLGACGCPAAAALRPFRFREASVASVPCLVSRTGYTGEDGFELLCPGDDAARLWEALLGSGAAPCGLGARDTLRLEAGLPLYGHELSREISPLEAGLSRFVRVEGRACLGAEALRRMAAEGPPRRLVGLLPEPPAIARAGAPCLAGGRPVGHVTSGTYAPTLGRAAALGLIRSGAEGPLAVDVRGRTVPAEVAPLPLYRRPRP